MTRRISLFPTATSDALEAKRRFGEATAILQDCTEPEVRPVPSSEALEKATKIKRMASKLVMLLENGIDINSVGAVDIAAQALGRECLSVQTLTLQTRKQQ